MGRLAKQVRVFDPETGEIVKDTVNYGGQNEEGFMLMYKEALARLNQEAPDFTTLRVFNALAIRQEYESGVNPHPTKVGRFQVSFKETDCLSTIRFKLRYL